MGREVIHKSIGRSAENSYFVRDTVLGRKKLNSFTTLRNCFERDRSIHSTAMQQADSIVTICSANIDEYTKVSRSINEARADLLLVETKEHYPLF